MLLNQIFPALVNPINFYFFIISNTTYTYLILLHFKKLKVEMVRDVLKRGGWKRVGIIFGLFLFHFGFI